MRLKKTFHNEIFQIFEKQEIILSLITFFPTLHTVGHRIRR